MIREKIELSLIAMCWSLFGHQVCSGRRCDFGRSNVNGLCFGLVQYRDRILSLITTEIEKVENPYKDIVEAYGRGDPRGDFEFCRQSILNLLKEQK